ncbi:MAG: lysylphosphatidylglycerol synthase domain-containing protein [Gaiellaceae bacterium]
MHIFAQLDKRALVAAGAALAVFGLVVSTPELLGDRVGEALAGLAAASPLWLWLAALSFFALIVCTGCAWRAGVAACDGGVGTLDATARYAAGSLVNALAPGGLGGPVRIALFSRTIPTRDRIWTSAGIATAIGVARAPALALLVLAAALTAGFPLWPLLLLVGGTVLAVLVAAVTRGWTPHARVAHVLDVFRALGRCPVAAVRLAGWVSLATAARVAAAAAIAASLGVASPLRAALIMIPALALAGLVPLTPGNIGVGSGAIAVALHLLGVDGSTAIATGIAFQAVETAVSLAAGSAALLCLARLPAWTLRVAAAGACLALAGGFSATVLV